MKRIVLYLLAAYLLYLFKMWIAGGMDIKTVVQYLMDRVFTAHHLLKLPIYTQSAICPVAWFLITLLECYAFKLVMGRWLRYMGYLGLLVGMLVVLPPIGDWMDFPLSNPWLWGIPCFVLGDLLREHQDRLLSMVNRRWLVLLALTGVTINLLSRYYGTQWWYIGNLFSAPSLFLLFGGSGMKYSRFCLLGSRYAFFIYIVHPIVGFFLIHLQARPTILEQWLRPLLALTLTIMLAVAFYCFKAWLGALRKSEHSST
mgnify:CR=1 FL=1